MSERYPGGLITKNPVVPSGPYETSTASGIWTLDQQAYYRKLNQWPTAGNPVPDAQFNYVTMLLHGDGTNGAQNNTFLDSSSNTFTITRNGNTTQGSFSPYGSNWANSFRGIAGDNLSAANNAAFALGSGNFTVECWFYVNNLTTAMCMFENRPSNTALGINLFINYDAPGQVQYRDSSGAPISSSITVTAGSWNHYALVRSGSTITLWINGQSGGTVTRTTNFTNTTCVLAQDQGGGFNFAGYLSNFRMVVGTAVYTSAFTPSTTPFTAISGTSILTCQSNRFKDNSTNDFPMTLAGVVSVQRFNPFGTSTAYSTSVIGGSGYFDGSGDYLGCGSQSAYAFGTGDFTLNAWFYLTSAPTYMSIADTRTSGWALAIDASRAIYLYSDAVGFVVTSAVGAVPLNAWTYVSVKRVSGTMTLYLNAVSINSAANSTNFSNTTLTVGANGSGGEPFFGYISDFQAIKGTGTTPTLPTAPLTNVTNTSLLLNYTNGAIFDNAMMTNLETAGNAQISTSVKKYGTGSIYNPATVTGSGLKCYLGVNGNITGDYTLEWWAYHINLNGGINHVMLGPWGSQLLVRVDNGTSYQIYIANVSRLNISVASSGIVAATWQHYAITRSGSTSYAFVNGTQVGTWTQTGTVDFSTILIAAENAGTSLVADQLNGYMDDIRITNGYARYTANFTAPTEAFPNTGPY